jgi:hypothetical protein
MIGRYNTYPVKVYVRIVSNVFHFEEFCLLTNKLTYILETNIGSILGVEELAKQQSNTVSIL